MDSFIKKQIKEPSFDMKNSQNKYIAYLSACDHKNANSTKNKEKREILAIDFLSSICDDYLNRWDGDFIEIKMSDEFQR